MVLNRRIRIAAAVLATSVSGALAAAPGAVAANAEAGGSPTTRGGGSGDYTLGPTDMATSTGQGACGGPNSANRPCVVLTTALPGATLASPCTGNVTRFRLNGVPSTNTYRLRVLTRNETDNTYTATASGDPVSLDFDGVNTFTTSVPIAAGQYVGVDFLNSSVNALRYRFFGPGVGAPYIYNFPADGNPDTPNGVEESYYLFNAVVTCAPPTPPGPGTNPAPGGTGSKAKCKKRKKKKGKKKSAAAAKKKKGCKKKKKNKK